MITIFSENIDKYDVIYMFNEENKKMKGVAKIILKGPCQVLYAAAPHQLHNCRLLTLHSIDIKTFEEVFKQAFPKIQKGIKQTKRARSLFFKQAYKPLELVSVESSATISTRTLKVTTDSSAAGYVEETRMSTISSRKSHIRIPEKDTILLKLDDSVNSSLSNIEKVELKTKQVSKYSQEFISRLVDIEENENEIGGYGDNLNANLERTGNYGATTLNLLNKNNSTTLMGSSYSTNLIIKDNESIIPDVFYSIENIDSAHKETIEQKADINNRKTEMGREPNGISSLGIRSSPDSSSLPSQSSIDVTNQGNTSESSSFIRYKRTRKVSLELIHDSLDSKLEKNVEIDKKNEEKKSKSQKSNGHGQKKVKRFVLPKKKKEMHNFMKLMFLLIVINCCIEWTYEQL